MKKKIADIVLVASILLIVAVVIYGVAHRGKKQDVADRTGYFEEEETYYLGEHELAEFSETIIEQFHKESRLVVYSADASVSVDLKQTGLFDIDILNKTQKVVYKGGSSFYVDLSMLGKHSISLDNGRRIVAIEIPHTEMTGIEIDPNKFTFEEAQKGLLAFGDLKFTAQEYNSLETECKEKMRAAIDTETNRNTADERAIEEMIRIYEPIVKAIDDGYSVKIVFMED